MTTDSRAPVVPNDASFESPPRWAIELVVEHVLTDLGSFVDYSDRSRDATPWALFFEAKMALFLKTTRLGPRIIAGDFRQELCRHYQISSLTELNRVITDPEACFMEAWTKLNQRFSELN